MPVAAAAVPAQAAPAMAEAVGAGPSAGPGIDEDLQVGESGCSSRFVEGTGTGRACKQCLQLVRV
jgi:hypothetical protein